VIDVIAIVQENLWASRQMVRRGASSEPGTQPPRFLWPRHGTVELEEQESVNLA